MEKSYGAYARHVDAVEAAFRYGGLETVSGPACRAVTGRDEFRGTSDQSHSAVPQIGEVSHAVLVQAKPA